MAQTSLGTKQIRKTVHEESYVISIGFPFTGSGSDYYQNMQVKLDTDGNVSPVTAVTDRVFGRVVSAWQGTDTSIRVAVPFESVIRVYSDAGINESQELSCSGHDATSGLPKFKVSTTGDWVSAICLVGAANTETGGYVGLLRCGYKKPA